MESPNAGDDLTVEAVTGGALAAGEGGVTRRCPVEELAVPGEDIEEAGRTAKPEPELLPKPESAEPFPLSVVRVTGNGGAGVGSVGVTTEAVEEATGVGRSTGIELPNEGAVLLTGTGR